MRNKIKIIPLILATVMLLTSCGEPVEPPLPQVTEETAQKPRLQDDFYGYSNWEFIDNTQIPYGKNQYGVFIMQNDVVDDRINDLLEEFSKSDPKHGSNEQKLKDVYLQYFDEDTRNKVGIEPFKKALENLDSVKSPDDFVEASAFIFNNYGCTGIFDMTAEIDYYNSSVYVPTIGQMNMQGMNKDYLKDSSNVNSFGDFASFILTKLGASEEDAKKRACDVAAMLKDVADTTLSVEETMDPECGYNPYNADELAKLYTNIDTNAMLKAFNISSKKIVVQDVEQAKKINGYLTEQNLTMLKDYATILLFASYRSALPPDYTKALSLIRENSFDKTKSAQDIVKLNFITEISGIYADRFCSEQTKKEIRSMIDDIERSLKERIQQSDRLSDDGKKKLVKKLDNIVENVGDYDSGYTGKFDIVSSDKGGNLLENLIVVNRYYTVNELQKYKDKPNRNKSPMGAQESNAIYNPYLNTITIPAAMMGDYFYDPERPYAYNLGMIGDVIAHELNHAFDSYGFLFDDKGCYNADWFSQEDKDAYKKVQESIIEYYNNYKLLDVYSVNGESTLGENIADIGAMECITKLVDNKKDLKLLFEGFAFQDASVENVATTVDMLYVDEHSPGEARVNAVLSTTNEFYKVYDIKKDDGMYIAPSSRVKVW